MENNNNPHLFAISDIQIQKQLTPYECFRILIAYIFVMLLVQSIVSFIFLKIVRSIYIDVAVDNIAIASNLVSRFIALVVAAYFIYLMVRKYFPAPTVYLSFGQIGVLRCSNKSAALAVILGIVFAIFFEYLLPSRYPADPIVLEKMRDQLGEDSVWKTFFLLLITVGMTPIVEEVFFRGFLYGAFSRYSGKVVSALIVTAIFVLLHYQAFSYWVALVSLLVGSITLIAVREISASLIPSILLHQFYNLGVAISQ
jgi:membrane protease YdiL (CAAX protease family)